jgi:uncharacterized membrane protein
MIAVLYLSLPASSYVLESHSTSKGTVVAVAVGGSIVASLVTQCSCTWILSMIRTI